MAPSQDPCPRESECVSECMPESFTPGLHAERGTCHMGKSWMLGFFKQGISRRFCRHGGRGAGRREPHMAPVLVSLAPGLLAWPPCPECECQYASSRSACRPFPRSSESGLPGEPQLQSCGSSVHAGCHCDHTCDLTNSRSTAWWIQGNVNTVFPILSENFLSVFF